MNYEYWQTPFLKNEWGQMEKYTLKVFKDRIICNCVNGLWNPKRDTESHCKHVSLFRQDCHNLEMKGWFKIDGAGS
jgi:uncharacterized linocin/CFP29 family protein